jgi:hypothetical protein
MYANKHYSSPLEGTDLEEASAHGWVRSADRKKRNIADLTGRGETGLGFSARAEPSNKTDCVAMKNMPFRTKRKSVRSSDARQTERI